MYLNQAKLILESINKPLYHASSTQGLKEVTPKIGSSHDMQKIARIYASYDPKFASAFTFRWDDTIASLGRVNSRPYIFKLKKECLDGRMDKPCSIYEVDPTNFTRSGHSISELISTKPAKVLKEHKFNTSWDAMKYYGLIVKKEK